MSARHNDLPIMIGHKLGKGLLIMRSKCPDTGFDMWIVWLNREKEYKRGESFEMGDIRKVDHVLHFCDKESVETTIKGLQTMLKMWGGEKRGSKTKEARGKCGGDPERAAQAGSK